ncbi:hypothetical protein KEU06_09375 [Pseudaminobacter sp. 19-2017]|uniref:Uncharacterized protein n=1 Tax=Pseudaminobacter soli (ex Zhang et al. 2022) TaxID=2831468 RepID=A0A942I7X6_9HYPH|nr:hypothetical protein [Pseudaminobacter soli]MBS3648815.1 hypothetical protein [Pseudaminobacter soli]
MYVIRTHTVELADKRFLSSDTLTEMTAKELRTAEAENRSGIEYNIVTAEMARRYVKQGMVHETGLWVDMDGKVRYAKAGE